LARAVILVARPDGKAQVRFSWPMLLTAGAGHQVMASESVKIVMAHLVWAIQVTLG